MKRKQVFADPGQAWRLRLITTGVLGDLGSRQALKLCQNSLVARVRCLQTGCHSQKNMVVITHWS